MAGETPAIQMLLSDVVMPDLSGPEVASRIQMAHPEIRVLFMSGYTDEAVLAARCQRRAKQWRFPAEAPSRAVGSCARCGRSSRCRRRGAAGAGLTVHLYDRCGRAK